MSSLGGFGANGCGARGCELSAFERVAPPSFGVRKGSACLAGGAEPAGRGDGGGGTGWALGMGGGVFGIGSFTTASSGRTVAPPEPPEGVGPPGLGTGEGGEGGES